MDFRSIDGTYEAFFARECEIMTYDRVVLVSLLRSRASDPENFVLFPEIVSKEPLGPVVKQGDQEWFDVVRWTTYATIAAEELSITSGNVTELLETETRPEARRLLGLDGMVGEAMGLPDDWAVNIIRHVGNYAEIFDRHIGKDSPLNLQRGLNATWRNGGLHYAPPIR